MTSRVATPGAAADAQPAPCADARITTAPVHRDNTAPSPTALAELHRDAVALTWDLTVHQLHQAFARCLAPAVNGVDGSAAAHELSQAFSGTSPASGVASYRDSPGSEVRPW